MPNESMPPSWLRYYSLLFCVFFFVVSVILVPIRGPHISIEGLFILSAMVSLALTTLWAIMRSIFVRAQRRNGGV